MENNLENQLYPAGFVASLNIYLYSPSLDLEVRVNIKGFRQPLYFPHEPSAEALIKSLDSSALAQNGLSDASDWRFMTAAEVQKYEEGELWTNIVVLKPFSDQHS